MHRVRTYLGGGFLALASLLMPALLAPGQEGWTPGGHFGQCYVDLGPCFETGQMLKNPGCNTEDDPHPLAKPGSVICAQPHRADVQLERFSDRLCLASENGMNWCQDRGHTYPCVIFQQWRCVTYFVYEYSVPSNIMLSRFGVCVMEEEIEEPFSDGYRNAVMEASDGCPPSGF